MVKEKSGLETEIYHSTPLRAINTLESEFGEITMYKKPSSQNTIIMFNDKPQNSGIIYEPEFIINSIKAKYPREFGDK